MKQADFLKVFRNNPIDVGVVLEALQLLGAGSNSATIPSSATPMATGAGTAEGSLAGEASAVPKAAVPGPVDQVIEGMPWLLIPTTETPLSSRNGYPFKRSPPTLCFPTTKMRELASKAHCRGDGLVKSDQFSQHAFSLVLGCSFSGESAIDHQQITLAIILQELNCRAHHSGEIGLRSCGLDFVGKREVAERKRRVTLELATQVCFPAPTCFGRCHSPCGASRARDHAHPCADLACVPAGSPPVRHREPHRYWRFPQAALRVSSPGDYRIGHKRPPGVVSEIAALVINPVARPAFRARSNRFSSGLPAESTPTERLLTFIPVAMAVAAAAGSLTAKSAAS